MNKIAVIKEFVKEFERELGLITASALAAHEAATHEEAKSEDKHDTRAIEASYLAKGQSVRILSLREALAEMKSYLENSSTSKKVEPGSLLTLSLQGKTHYYFFSNNGGGTKINLDGISVNLLTKDSPLGDALFGAGTGDEVEVEIQNQLKAYRLEAIS